MATNTDVCILCDSLASLFRLVFLLSGVYGLACLAQTHAVLIMVYVCVCVTMNESEMILLDIGKRHQHA